MVSEESSCWCCFLKLNLGRNELVEGFGACGRNRLELKHLFVLPYNNGRANRNFQPGRAC